MGVVSSGPVSSLRATCFWHVLDGYLGTGQPAASHDKTKTPRTMNDTIGVDISKASLEVWRLCDRKHMRFSNDKLGLGELCRWLGPNPIRVV